MRSMVGRTFSERRTRTSSSDARCLTCLSQNGVAKPTLLLECHRRRRQVREFACLCWNGSTATCCRLLPFTSQKTNGKAQRIDKK